MAAPASDSAPFNAIDANPVDPRTAAQDLLRRFDFADAANRQSAGDPVEYIVDDSVCVAITKENIIDYVCEVLCVIEMMSKAIKEQVIDYDPRDDDSAPNRYRLEDKSNSVWEYINKARRIIDGPLSDTAKLDAIKRELRGAKFVNTEGAYYEWNPFGVPFLLPLRPCKLVVYEVKDWIEAGRRGTVACAFHETVKARRIADQERRAFLNTIVN